MEVTRIEPVQAQRVERAGKEQDRRRQHDRPGESFAEDLQEQLDTSADHDPAPPVPPGAAYEPVTQADAPLPLPQVDVVTLSPAGLVSSETLQARGGLRFSLASSLAMGLRALGLLAERREPHGTAASPVAGTPAVTAPESVDRLA